MAFSTPPRNPIEAGKVSPVINRTAERKAQILSSKRLYSWAVINFVCALLLFAELSLQTFQCWLGVKSNLLWYGILGLTIILTTNAMINFSQAAYSSFSCTPLALSPEQKRLMGIRLSDANFVSHAIASRTSPTTPSRKLFSLASLLKPRQQQTSTPVDQGHAFSRNSPSPTQSPGSSFQTTVGTPSYHGNVTGGSYNVSDSFNMHKATSLGATLDGSSYIDSSGGSPFLRHRRSPFVNSPLPSEDYMTEQKVLNSYLKSQFEKDQSKSHMHGFDSSLTGSGAYWSYGSSFLDYSVELSRNLYQLSTRSPKSPTTSKSSKDDQSKDPTMEYWNQAGVDRNCLVEWIARLRRWISLTVLRGIVKECNKVNAQLKHIGCPEVQVGESSLSALKQIQQSKASQIPRLTWVLPYLEVTQNQEYLLERLRTLASGGYMSEYKWDKGGKMKGREWAEDLPSDSAIIMHMFCCYMDAHLPPHPRFPDGKTFTSQYFVQTPHKPNVSSDTKMEIFQSKLQPPHYLLATKDKTYDPPSLVKIPLKRFANFRIPLVGANESWIFFESASAILDIEGSRSDRTVHCLRFVIPGMKVGRHHLFIAVLLFLHWIKTKESSMLGQVNLDLSGINLLCVIEPISRTRGNLPSPKDRSSAV